MCAADFKPRDSFLLVPLPITGDLREKCATKMEGGLWSGTSVGVVLVLLQNEPKGRMATDEHR